jgi:Dolichyl-phosphate-mannose-protein mannosyltransferase
VKSARTAAPFAALAALLAGALPFAARTTAWPEIVTPAWFVAQGVRLYDGILFPHTPLLILLTAAAGSLFGFSAAVLRALPALALAASAVLLVLGARPHGSSRRGPIAGLLLGVPLLALLTVYADGPALWPEPFLAPFLLAGVLLLERAGRTGGARDFAAAGLVFGTALLVKQTSAWAVLAAVLWLLLRSRRRDPRAAFLFAAAAALPYVAFLLTWALAFRTFAHARWTLVYPVFSGMSREIAVTLTVADVHEALVLFLPFAALALAAAALPLALSRRTPLLAVAAGAIGMAWPRPGLLHLSAVTGLAALAAVRTALALPAAFRCLRRGRPGHGRLLAPAGSAALLAVSVGVAVLGAGPLLVDRLGGPLFYWDDALTRAEAASVRTHVPAGAELLVFGGRQTLYPITGTHSPGGFYVNPSFWYCLNRDGGDERLVAALRSRPGLPVLYRAPSGNEAPVRATKVFAFLEAETAPDETGVGGAGWRRVAGRR